MKQLAWLLKWLLKAAIFFALFAFALNNQQDATVHFFFGTQWRTPLVLVVLTAFAAGVAVGILGMVPRWWKHRHAAKSRREAPPDSTQDSSLIMPPHHGL
jgi:putative membrane protein